MRRILLRSGKLPFEVMDHVGSRLTDSFAGNTGNFAFADSVFKTLYTEDTEILSSYHKHLAKDAERINNEFDYFVIPLANAFRPDFVVHLNSLTSLIKKLSIPCIVVGVGVQAELTGRVESNEVIEATKRFIGAVLDKSSTVGVRGEITYEYLRKMGFSNIEIIRCPSMFYNGANLKIAKKTDELEPNSIISFNGSKVMPNQLNLLLKRSLNTYPHSYIISQVTNDLDLLLWGKPVKNVEADFFPDNLKHPNIVKDKMRFFVDLSTWIDFLKTASFSFGSRIHGNIVAALAGIPCYLVSTDARTLEIAKYHNIPYRQVDDYINEISLSTLYENTDFSIIEKGHAQRFYGYLNFLEKNGLRHIYQSGESRTRFENRIKECNFPSAVRSLTSLSQEIVAERLERLHEHNWRKEKRLRERIKYLEVEIHTLRGSRRK